jgi:hypothetical protein
MGVIQIFDQKQGRLLTMGRHMARLFGFSAVCGQTTLA